MALYNRNKKAFPKISRRNLKTKHTFPIKYMECQPMEKKNTGVKDGIRTLLFSCFEHLGPDEKDSIEICFAQGNIYVIGAFPNADGTTCAKLEFIGAILFTADYNGIWV